LVQEDRIRVGSVELEFSLYDEPVTDDVAAKTMAELNSYKRLFEFSQKLMASYEIPTLFDQLLDVVIQVTHADKGFIVLLESGEPVVKVARNLRHETISDAVSHLSDAILARVMATKQPLIISDALNDTELQGFALGDEPAPHIRDVRALARTRQLDRDHLRGQRQRGPAF